jgi:nucleoside-diphosphate-sugar epimerase
MRVLMIGGNGFIGPAVVERLLSSGHDVTLFHRGTKKVFPELNHIIGDRRQLAGYADVFRELAPDVVLDLILSNGHQAQDLMRTFKGIAQRVVALSSMDVYRACGVLHGLEPGPIEPVPLKEDAPLRTRLQTYPPQAIQRLKSIFTWVDDEYDKIPVEQAVMSEPELPGTVLRLPFVYGPRDPLHRLFPIIKRIDDGRRVILLDEEAAQWHGPRGYVENVAVAIAAAVIDLRAANRIYNVAEPRPFTELEWTQKVAQAAGWSGVIKVVPAERSPAHLKLPGNTKQHWIADTSRIRTELGYSETVPLEQALRTTITWQRANPPREIDPKQFDYGAEDACLTPAREMRLV